MKKIECEGVGDNDGFFEMSRDDMTSHALNPTKYGSVSCGVSPHKDGDLLMVKDVVLAIDIITDDDSMLEHRLYNLRAFLTD